MLLRSFLQTELTLLTLLTWTALLVSAFGSLFAKTAMTVRQAWCRMPWGVIIVLGGVQVATRLVEEYDLLPQLFKMFKPTFWTARSHIEVQAILATISSMLAEATNNRTLSVLMMPIVQDIAETKNVYPMYYAIPVVVGASSNVIMPVSIPMVVMHDVGRVPFVRLVRAATSMLITTPEEKSELFIIRPSPRTLPTAPITVTLAGRPIPEVDTIRILGLHIQNNGRNTFTIRILKRVTEALSHLLVLGIVLKMVLVGVVLLTVNAIGRTLYDWGNQHVVPDA
ncbi:hypothetical protein HPB52_005285 [Rhipicephalus sanguineus]|uniref:Uncharacterized protein n=1 Tax=Rhipicephalus sanguineus TaxID=34632 RepID=A0A9D4SXP7_RHISA|nr:hypothetical protein HPB52_005285 [Rhipicephalus sanguineus]